MKKGCYCEGCEHYHKHECDVVWGIPVEADVKVCKRAGWRVAKRDLCWNGRVPTANDADRTRWREGNGRR